MKNNMCDLCAGDNFVIVDLVTSGQLSAGLYVALWVILMKSALSGVLFKENCPHMCHPFPSAGSNLDSWSGGFTILLCLAAVHLHHPQLTASESEAFTQHNRLPDATQG